MITVDKINKTLGDAEDMWEILEEPVYGLAFLLGKALVHAIIYAAELISKSLRNK